MGAVLAILVGLAVVLYWKVVRPELERQAVEREKERVSIQSVAAAHRESSFCLERTASSLVDVSGNLLESQKLVEIRQKYLDGKGV